MTRARHARARRQPGHVTRSAAAAAVVAASATAVVPATATATFARHRAGRDGACIATGVLDARCARLVASGTCTTGALCSTTATHTASRNSDGSAACSAGRRVAATATATSGDQVVRLTAHPHGRPTSTGTECLAILQNTLTRRSTAKARVAARGLTGQVVHCGMVLAITTFADEDLEYLTRRDGICTGRIPAAAAARRRNVAV